MAFFITFRCRGTWLHGDERGSIDRRNNRFGAPRHPDNPAWQKMSAELLAIDPVYLHGRQRSSVKKAIKATCKKRNWGLFALNVRTNHVHAVVNAGDIKGSKVLHALKSNATRQMREDGVWLENISPWSSGGSKRLLWNEISVDAAIGYVLYGQGDELPSFD